MQSVHNQSRPRFIPASIEISPKQAIESADLPGLFPAGTRVYITDLGESVDVMVGAARRVSDLGYNAVPHVGTRRVQSRQALEERIRASTQEAGVRDILLIGGETQHPAGPFSSSLDVLETGIIDRYGISHLGIAGHPEGSRDFPETAAIKALKFKKAAGERSGAEVRIVTQFGFNAAGFIAWAEALHDHGVDLPVHLGVAGPAKIGTLLKYAAICGVGNSLDFLKKRGSSLTALATGHSPESVVGPVESHVRANSGSAIVQIHVFPFGGIRKSAEWLVERGSWNREGVEARSCEG
jgi:methylenetetrahydrofolate reductase (NADPH)